MVCHVIKVLFSMPTKPLILKRRQLAKTRLFQIEEQDLQFANGARRVYERLLRSGDGAVLIVPMLDDETVLLVREYGAGIGDYQIALPKGAIDPGEDALQAANRELMEEVGYGARELQLIKSLTLSPAYMEHDILVVLAEGLYESRLPGDEPETIEVIPWKLDDLAALVSRDDFTEGRSIAALFLVRDLLNNRAAIKR
ncbi:MAG: ADP-ribose diphosphatase [Porticoccus sp.]|jgi:ADP-ribose diphosphatase